MIEIGPELKEVLVTAIIFIGTGVIYLALFTSFFDRRD